MSPDSDPRPGQEGGIEWLDARRGLVSTSGGVQGFLAVVCDDAAWVHWQGRAYHLLPTRRTPRTGGMKVSPEADRILRSPMPGSVRSVNAAAGDRVPAGQVVVVVEAMKMEHELRCPWPARVAAVLCAAGQRVDAQAPLVELAPDGDSGTVERGAEAPGP